MAGRRPTLTATDVDHSQDINRVVFLLCRPEGHWDSLIPLQIIKQLLQKDYGKTGWYFQMNSLTEKIDLTKTQKYLQVFPPLPDGIRISTKINKLVYCQ